MMKFLPLLLLLLTSWGPPGSLGEGIPQENTLSATSPHFDEEEKYSTHMPQHLRCDACQIISYQMWKHLSDMESKPLGYRAKGDSLSESEYTDVLEKSCSQSWMDYGVHEVNKVKHFVGPGLDKTVGITMMMTGGPWPGRLFKMCHNYLGEFGEDQLYGEYRQGGREALERLLCKETCPEEETPGQAGFLQKEL
ncbi:marginal zone B- and B1-cell-specific protein [Monodelphis domestica]|uniref:marginal zone B- and B1-cell-specific protein n=1 Tax=Monodelphis domestica TaxID=13616 RepID=UPI0024E1C44A|nr:marginal zone B- and B1-cell-specific protein [Monodelphis domestica]